MIAAQKLGLIFLDFEPRWRSLRPIHANSHFAYTRAFPGLSVFKVNVNQEQELHTTILLMKKRELTRLVLFANRFPDCKKLIDVIDRRLPHLNEFIFHIDGAFTYYLNDWIRILQRLRGRKVCLVAASTAQAELVDRILEPYLDVQITVCPFGVSGKLSSAKLRTRTRAALGLKTEEIALTAVGRISKFKNLDVLVDFFQQYLSTSPKRLRLFIAGSFDDNAGNFGQSGPHGKYFYAWQRWFKGLPQHVQDQISFCGELERGEVEALYAGSDVFVSLSTFHDEDFGMAPIEALTSGCPAILSGWGGYHDFALNREAIRLVPVRFGVKGLELNYTSFARALDHYCSKKNSQKARQQRGRLFLRHFSSRSLIAKYRKLHTHEPNRLCRTKKEIGEESPKDLFRTYSGQYRKIYQSYLSPQSRS